MMQTLTNILLVIGAALILWLTFSTVKKHPQTFSVENMNKSIFTLGILALLLIGVIAILIMLLKNS